MWALIIEHLLIIGLSLTIGLTVGVFVTSLCSLSHCGDCRAERDRWERIHFAA